MRNSIQELVDAVKAYTLCRAAEDSRFAAQHAILEGSDIARERLDRARSMVQDELAANDSVVYKSALEHLAAEVELMVEKVLPSALTRYMMDSPQIVEREVEWARARIKGEE